MIVLAVIPARGGSKSVPLKNIKELCGKPLLAYSIESALRAGSVDKVVVSTDHPQIAKVAKQYGAEVIIRPPELATDEAPTEWALLHVLDELKQNDDYEPDVILTLEPTSPFRTLETIGRCIAAFNTTDSDSVIGVLETRSCYGRIINGRFEFLFPGQSRRRQDRQPLYKESSTIYGTRTGTLKRNKSVLGDKLYPLLIPEEEAIDINTHFDFRMAEIYMQLKIN
ncbi:MAG: acylneuraminate cytidylyltransferase family protein [Nitrospirota bacterium]